MSVHLIELAFVIYFFCTIISWLSFSLTLYSAGDLYWETQLAGRIVPALCKVKPGRVRVELKLKKAEPEPWTDYEVHLQCVHVSVCVCVCVCVFVYIKKRYSSGRFTWILYEICRLKVIKKLHLQLTVAVVPCRNLPLQIVWSRHLPQCPLH